MHYNFEWDPVKAQRNLQKHGVSFEEAAEIFLDPLQLSIPDEEHDADEERWITVGVTKGQKLRLVVHTFLSYHDDPDHFEQITIRIISARPATSHEQKQYEDKL